MLWSETRNLISPADDAWFEMFATTRDQAELKRQSGRDARGRKNEKPVIHLSLSWAIGEKPTPQHMLETATSALNALGLADHQAVIAAHGDKDHLHVHLVVNSIHPVTGLTAELKYSKERLSRWAEAYERAHGIHCDERIINNSKRERHARAREAADALMPGSSATAAKPPYVPVKHQGPNRQQWFTRKTLKDRMSRLRAEMDLTHKGERDQLWQRHKMVRSEITANTQAAVDHAREYVRAQFKPQWKDLYRAHRSEAKFVANAALLERAVFVFSRRERLGLRKPLSLRQAISFIRSPGKLLDRIDAVHERDRRSLSRVEKTEAKIYTEKIWTQYRTKVDRLIAEQTSERASLRNEQFGRTRGVTLEHAKASLAADMPKEAANDPGWLADEIKLRMAEWRARNGGKDFGREL